MSIKNPKIKKAAATITEELQGIRIYGPNTAKNRDLGLELLRFDKDRAVKVFRLDETSEVANVINQMDGF